MTEAEVITAMTLWALIASVGSVALAIIAIGLSAIFYKMSDSITKSTREAANNIESGVDQMKLFVETLYRDTFSLFKDTHQKMGDQLWSDGTIDADVKAQTDKRVDEIKAEVKNEIATTLKDQTLEMDDRLDKIEEIINNSVDEARTAESKVLSQSIKKHLLEYFNAKINLKGLSRTKYKVMQLIKSTGENTEYSFNDILATLFEMDQEGIIELDKHVPHKKAEVRINIEKVAELLVT